ncbi:MAG: hypothetical protein PQJ61_07965 [Spirochaetales bacterium]|uniref:PEGA domain-containing protein n=1 Tax=Candidatus Thalassospirochaeta sargassi TaxID=3119039 RepID=A0AAJ1II77_9SPIO|nr:hypothetical protein [Spirochaetales bacterium]
MKKLTAIFILLITLFIPFSVFAENIRGDVVKHIVLTDNFSQDGAEFLMNIEDVFAISFKDDTEFISGVEIEVNVPSGLRSYGSSFAFNIYNRISPEISSGIGTYYGRKYHSFILPEAARFYIRLPYKTKIEGESGPYTTVLSNVLEYGDSPVMVTVLPMMKGFPSSLYNSNFSIKVKPILADSGNLDLNIDIPEGLSYEDLTVKIDGKNRAALDNLKLTAGSHSLNISIPGGKNIVRNFSISRGETTILNLVVEGLESWASIDVPEKTLVYMDGEKIELSPEKRIKMTPGEHTVLFKIDDYKISKKFEVQPGKDCKISLFLDIFVEEN